MTKIDGKTFDIEDQNIKKLKELFPEVDTDGKIDFEKLKQVLGEYVDDSEERYKFTWNGKGEALRISQTQSTGTLRPAPEEGESKNWDSTGNLYIEGDNLEVLKLLQKSYFGKIKMIYIDPPYNTGKDFVYKDNYKDNIKNYKKITGQVDNEGKTTTTNSEHSGRYHTDWLNMMYPRLRLARNLLTEDGVIFISIDDNEAHNLRKILDEIFGESNRVTSLYTQVRYANKSLTEKDDFQKVMENILVYKKNEFNPVKPYENYSIEKFCYKIIEKDNPEKVKIGNRKVQIFKENQYEIKKVKPNMSGLKETWASGTVLTGNASGKYFNDYLSIRPKIDGYKILYKVYGIGEDGLGYRYFTGPKSEKYTKGKFYSGIPLFRVKEIESGESRKYKPIPTLYNYAADFGNISHEGNMVFRSGKKPIKMINSFIDMIEGNDFIVLDFFSGSSSTAHAVMDSNYKDNGNRKYIMVQLPEPTEEDSDYRKENLNNIAEIGKERIRRAGDKIKSELEKKYREASEDERKDMKNPDELDIGFKVFKLDTSNIKVWNPGKYDNIQIAIEDSTNPYLDGRTEEDVVYEMILKMGSDLTYPVEKHQIADKVIYSIGYGLLMICLSDNIDLSIAKKMIEIKNNNNQDEFRAIFRDGGFNSDKDKTNIKETLKSEGLAEESFITL